MIYRVEWIDYDTRADYLFEHDSKTEEQFKADCIKAIREVGEKYLNEEKGWVSAPNWIEAAAKKMADYGYKPIDPITWYHFGSDIIGNCMYDDNAPISDEDEEWKEIVGDILFKRALEKNLVVKISLDKDTMEYMIKRDLIKDPLSGQFRWC